MSSRAIEPEQQYFDDNAAAIDGAGETATNIVQAAGQSVPLPPSVANQLISREFVMQWSGSLAELDAAPEKATWSVDDDMQAIFQSRTRYAPGCEKATERAGDLSRVCLVGMTIKKIDSTFPCNVALCIAGAKGNVYSNSGEQFAALISPNERNHAMDKTVVTTSPFVNSAYMQMYPNMTSANLRKEGIMQVPGENYCFVDQAHPIMEPVNFWQNTI